LLTALNTSLSKISNPEDFIKDNFFKIPLFVILSWIITFPLIWFCNAITG